MLFKISMQGSFLFLILLLFRKLYLEKIPQKVILMLWNLIFLRLMLPFQIGIPLRFQRLVRGMDGLSGMNRGQDVTRQMTNSIMPSTGQNQMQRLSMGEDGIHILYFVWVCGMASCFFCLGVKYVRMLRRFRTAIPITSSVLENWRGKYEWRRRISIRQSEYIDSPLAYGIWHPVILLPNQIDLEDEQSLFFVLEHEGVHIKHYDALRIVWMNLILCMHWFNPIVWLMGRFYTRDIELRCDEDVMQYMGSENRKNYAMTLISMEEKRVEVVPMFHNFCKDALEERIYAIMKKKRYSKLSTTIVIMIMLVVFLTVSVSAETNTDSSTTKMQYLTKTEQSKTDSKEDEIFYCKLSYALGYDKIGPNDVSEKEANACLETANKTLADRFSSMSYEEASNLNVEEAAKLVLQVTEECSSQSVHVFPEKIYYDNHSKTQEDKVAAAKRNNECSIENRCMMY